MLDSCPLVRSLGQLVDAGRSFVWMPGKLPFLGADISCVQIAADETKVLMPIDLKIICLYFLKTAQLDETSFGLAASSSAVPPPPAAPAEPAAEAVPVPAPDGDEDADSEKRTKNLEIGLLDCIVKANQSSIKGFKCQRIHLVTFVSAVVCIENGQPRRGRPAVS